jgi:hypothetical protein
MIALSGTGFASSTLYTVAECSRIVWTAPKGPCGTNNRVVVVTGSAGAFMTRFTVQLCSPRPTTKLETCYAGVLATTGPNQGQLVGPARITVLAH